MSTNIYHIQKEIVLNHTGSGKPSFKKFHQSIKGKKDTVTYDGNPHSVEGYEITDISNKLYKENDIGFTGEARAEGTAAGTYQMNLTAQQFSNIS